MAKLCFEDFPVGESVQSGAYRVSKDEIVEFASEFDPQDYHLDEEAAKHTMLGGLCASGWHVCSIAMRLMCDEYLNAADSMGSPGLEEVKWLKPVRPGDVLALRRTCIAARVSKSRPEMGICTFLWELVDQKDETVCAIKGLQLMRTRQHAGAA